MHNITEYITLLAHHLFYWDIKVSFREYELQKVYTYLEAIDGVFDVVKTKDSKKEWKDFIIVTKSKIINTHTVIVNIITVLGVRLRNPNNKITIDISPCWIFVNSKMMQRPVMTE